MEVPSPSPASLDPSAHGNTGMDGTLQQGLPPGNAGTHQQHQTGFCHPALLGPSVNPHSCVGRGTALHKERARHRILCPRASRAIFAAMSLRHLHLAWKSQQHRDPNAGLFLVGFRVFGTRRGWPSRVHPLGHAHHTMAKEQYSGPAGPQQGWVSGSAMKPLSSIHGAELQSGGVPLEWERWICRGCSGMGKVCSSLATHSVQPVQGAGDCQAVWRTMELSSEDRTHLQCLQTSPTKLVKEESFPRDHVPQADARYLVETQVRRTKSILRLLTPFTCPTVSSTSSRSWDGLHHAFPHW